jgi:glycosyltransferase involved in cell wall biosynthesis
VVLAEGESAAVSRRPERLLVIVPALNEADSIASVVADARSTLHADVVVVDDGSIDETGARARTAGATVLTLPYNLGVGGAIRTALRYAVAEGYQQVLQLDGDGQHEASEGARLVDVLQSGSVDLVVGSRFAAGYEIGVGRRIVMKILSKILSRRLHTAVTDTTSGFRAMGPDAIRCFAREYPLDYLSDTVEALLMAGDAGLTVREVDVRMRPRQGGSPSASPMKSAYHLVRLLLVVLVHSIRRKPNLLKSDGSPVRSPT